MSFCHCRRRRLLLKNNMANQFWVAIASFHVGFFFGVLVVRVVCNGLSHLAMRESIAEQQHKRHHVLA